MKKTILDIKGMHCRSCELLIEDELLKIKGVASAVVSQKKGCAEVSHEGFLNFEEIKEAVTKAGYELGKNQDKPFFSKDPNVYIDLAICGVVLFIVFYLANDLGLFNLVNSTSGNFSSLPIVFFIGLTAGLSTCMALVGGLILGASARFSEKHPEATSLQKFKPHLFFNLGRIASYFVFGGIIGYAGSFFQISPSVLGVLTIVVGLVMLLLGAQLTELFPRLSSFNFTLPKSISRLLGIKRHHEKEYSHKNSALMGALTFFLPCGFTQAMQLYAISSGSMVTGALTMSIFALGTAPGLLGIGGLTAVIRGAFAKTFFKFAGLVVISLAIFNISNGYNLTGLNVLASFTSNTSAQTTDSNVTIENGVQVVRMTQDSSGYSPNSFTIKRGIPVRWIINSVDIRTCAASIISAKLGVRQGLQEGENIIEFTPEEVGSFRFSCSMGMYVGMFNVIDDNENSGRQTNTQSTPKNNNENLQKQVVAGTKLSLAVDQAITPEPTLTPNPTETINAEVEETAVQLIKATYRQGFDIEPKEFTVQSGKPARFEVYAVDDGRGCMSSITIPGLVKKIELLTKGQISVFEFTPEEPGTYNITCGMGGPRGRITVN